MRPVELGPLATAGDAVAAADLVARTLRELPGTAREVLERAACLGAARRALE